MVTNDRELYRQIVATNSLPIFYQPWYLDAVCGEDKWQSFMYIEGGVCKAFWIANTREKLTVTYALDPKLTAYTGLYVLDGKVDISTLEMHVQEKHNYLEQSFHPSSNLINQESQLGTTYVIDSGIDSETAWGNLKSDYRRKIKKAEKSYTISNCNFNSFSETLSASFAMKKQDVPYDLNLLESLLNVCEQKGSAKLLAAKNGEGKVCGAALFLHDDLSTYYIAGGQIDGKASMYLLMWEGIKASLSANRAFDFEGSSIPGVAQFFRGFGGIKVEYPIYKYSSASWVSSLIALRKKWGR